MSIKAEHAKFDFKSEQDDQFALDYYSIVDTNIPLWAVKDELLYLMQTHHISHFKVPGTKTFDGNDYTFYFDISNYENEQINVYKYRGYQ